MSKDQGGRLVRHTPPRPSARPRLERPSLFAEMDSVSDVLDGDTQRVRILSTLESARHAQRLAPSAKRRRFALPKNWQLKALMGLMATGVLTLLVAFALIVMNGHQVAGQADEAELAQTQAARATSGKSPDSPLKATMAAAKADRNNPLAALIAAPASSSAAVAAAAPALTVAPRAELPQAQTAVIETIEPLPALASVVATKPPIHVVLAAQSNQPAMLAASAATSSTTRSIDASAYAVMTKPAKPAAKRATNQGRNDDDVALLEAMFAHTGSRTANRDSTPALSAADEIKTRCNVLSGAAAATCRARVCVQNPSAAICHQDP